MTVSERMFCHNGNLIPYQSTSVKQFLLENWNLSLDESDKKEKVEIPYFVKDNDANIIEFTKNFDIPDDFSYSRIKLWITGLHGNANIYLNNTLIKNHINLTTSYFINIEHLIKKKNNLLKIRLTKYDSEQKFHDLRFPNFLKQLRPHGIAREIYLELFPQKYIDNISFDYNRKKLALEYELNISDSSNTVFEKTVKLEEEVIAPDGKIIHKRFAYYPNRKLKKNVTRTIKIDAPLAWNHESPNLYKLILTIKSGTTNYFVHRQKFGLRNIEAKNSEIFINNEPIEIKGITYRYNFENNLHYLLNSLSDLQEIKKLGFNAVKFINYSPHPYTARYADSLGIYIFVDNGMSRLPSSFLLNNNNFNAAKAAITEIGNTFKNNASVLAVGTGNEINQTSPRTKKFILLLEKYFNDNFNVLTYFTPIDITMDVNNKTSDLLIIQNYVNPYQLFSLASKQNTSNIPILLGSINFPVVNTSSDEQEINNLYKFQRFLAQYDSLNFSSGYFIESFSDWKGVLPNLYSKFDDHNNVIYPYGLVDINRNKKEKFSFFDNILHDKEVMVSYFKSDNKNNFQSIVVFVFAIVFFLIYKRSYRLRENLMRSLQHPYGFFVDLRDRRIISVFNSTLMGITVGSIISGFISSIIYANHSSILFDEYLSIIINNAQEKLFVLSIINSPWKLFILILLSLSLAQIILVFILKFLGIFSKEKRKFRQIYSVISWSGSPLLFFIPIAIFAHSMAVNQFLYHEILWIFVIFLLWYNFRLANGFRVLYLIQPIKMGILIFLTYLILIITFLVYINMEIEVFEFLTTLVAAHNLY